MIISRENGMSVDLTKFDKERSTSSTSDKDDSWLENSVSERLSAATPDNLITSDSPLRYSILITRIPVGISLIIVRIRGSISLVPDCEATNKSSSLVQTASS